MTAFLGEWLSTDTGKVILYTVRLKDGTTPSFAGATNILLTARCTKPQRTFTLAGSVSDGPNRIFSFASPTTGTGFVAPAAGTIDSYEFVITYTLNAKSYATSFGRLAVRTFP